MADLWIDEIASAVRTAPDYLPDTAFGSDQWLSRMVAEFGAVAAEDRGVPADMLSYLPDVPDNDVAEQALTLLGPPLGSQPLYMSRSGGEADPFVTMLPRLIHPRDWVSDALVLTHLEALTGSAVFDFLAWSLNDGPATVLLVDQQVVTLTDQPKDPLTAIALRFGASGARVSAWGLGAPPSLDRGRTFHGTRSCDAWLGFALAVAAHEVAAGDVVVLHTAGDAQEGWVRLDMDRVPIVAGETRP